MQTYTDFSRQYSCMRAILQASKYDIFKNEFNNSGLIQVLIGIIEQGIDVNLELREIAFNILANLCREHRNNQKEFRRSNGIENIKKNLAYGLVEQTGNSSTFLLSVLDCLSNSVFGNKRSEMHFLDIEGVYVLLDMAETCEHALKRICISCLCTILENAKSFQYFVEWSSSSSQFNATQMLIKLYQDEDKRFNVSYDNGILQNVDRPLNPVDSYLVRKVNHENQSLAEGTAGPDLL